MKKLRPAKPSAPMSDVMTDFDLGAGLVVSRVKAPYALPDASIRLAKCLPISVADQQPRAPAGRADKHDPRFFVLVDTVWLCV